MCRWSTFFLFAALGFSQTTLVKTTKLLDVKSGRYLTDQGVLIRDGIICQVGPFDAVRSAAPGNAAALDLSGLTILPGLIDCHTHLLIAAPEKMNGADALILTIAKLSPMNRALLGAQLAREDLEAGFTIVRNVGHSGIDGDAALRDAIDNRWVPGPRILASARKIAPEGGQAIPVQSGVLDSILKEEFLTASNPDEGRRAVLANLRVAANWIKAVADEGPRTINLETMKAIVEEAHRGGVRVAVHASSHIGIQIAVDAGVDTIEHADFATEPQFQAMKTKGIFLVPTLWPLELTPHWPDLVAVDAPARLKTINGEVYLKRYAEVQRAKMDLARKTGVKIAFGSDEWFERDGKTRGQATLQVLSALTEFGMSPAEALRSATIDAAEMLHLQNSSGSIEAEKFGDLVGVEGDPLQRLGDIQNVRFVMKGGRVVKDSRK
jgi:imidazolonepropionase-like amidohydrolase